MDKQQPTLGFALLVGLGFWSLDPHGVRHATEIRCASTYDDKGQCDKAIEVSEYWEIRINQYSNSVVLRDPYSKYLYQTFLENCKIYDTDSWMCQSTLGNYTETFTMVSGTFHHVLAAPNTPNAVYSGIGYKASKLYQWHLLDLPQAVAFDRFLREW